MNDPKRERLPSGSAARRIREYETPFVPWDDRVHRADVQTHRGLGSLLQCPADDFVSIEVV
jgi:hypothetical protein